MCARARMRVVAKVSLPHFAGYVVICRENRPPPTRTTETPLYQKWPLRCGDREREDLSRNAVPRERARCEEQLRPIGGHSSLSARGRRGGTWSFIRNLGAKLTGTQTQSSIQRSNPVTELPSTCPTRFDIFLLFRSCRDASSETSGR